MRVVATVLLAILIAAAAPASADQPAASLEVVGHDDLGARGLNAGLAVAQNCAYVGSRGQGPVEIVDVSDPAHPHAAGSLPGRRLTTARELRAVPDSRLLVVMSYQLGAGGVNQIDLYQWTADCARLTLAGSYDFGRPPHEFFLWRQPGGSRTLLFVSFFSGGSGDLQVVDVTTPSQPTLAGTWSPPRGLLHSISVGDDGRRAFLSLWTGGLLVGDVSQFTSGVPGPQLILLTPPSSALSALPGGNVHSAVQVPGRDLVLVTDERYPPACPYGPARVVDVSDPAHLVAGATLAVPENDLATCRAAVNGTYTSHNPTIVGDLAFVSWYSAGLQVFNNPAQPERLVEFRPRDVVPGARDPQLGVAPAMTWSYPIVREGLIYVADINQGLYVLRYSGPHQEQIARTRFAEGNSNLTATLAPSPGPTPTLSPSVAPSSPPRSGPTAPPRKTEFPTIALIVAGLLLLAAVAGGAALVLTRRARRTTPRVRR